MKKRLLTLLAMVVAASLVLVAPVGAEIAPDGTYRGTVSGDFNVGFGDPSTPCPHITWTGTVDFGSEQYAIAWTPLVAGVENAFFHVIEVWYLFEDATFERTDGVLTTCEGVVAMEGLEYGVVNLTGMAKAKGDVVSVDPAGPFDDSLIGSAVEWRGSVGESGLTFTGLFRITPP